MKTRIISGVVAVVILIAALFLNNYWNPTATILLSIMAAIAAYEMLHNTGAVKNKTAVFSAAIYSFAVLYCYSGLLPISPAILTTAYVLVIIGIALAKHSEFGPDAITMSLAMPFLISYAFSSLEQLLNGGSYGIFYLVLLINFSSIADTFAYFTGMAFGKHKLAPVISPKKTIEGAVGGMVGSIIGTVVICLVFNAVYDFKTNMLALCLITPFMVAVGIMGDLFTSAIKRTYGVKDYGKLMPGHGGILDRFDSVLLCAPVLALFLRYVEVFS